MHEDIIVIDRDYNVIDINESAIKRSGRSVNEIIAVSYTHLRAHETVLDLVCRLLLEKKNSP